MKDGMDGREGEKGEKERVTSTCSCLSTGKMENRGLSSASSSRT